ncbi:10860_t:CDS:2 [Cetraspora pellucida]|uniref:10860_t:CDS:1 n=1 Tax=Cetraspora pellucida TaxID=1433469 RepID=A0ACA9LQ99_9GLOM|nr:10860_t:CDS:2 [Cetraspora pellucida]
MLEGIPENIDEITGNLRSHIIDDCIEKFSEHIISLVPILKIPQFELQNAYFNDFATIISHGKINNSQILRRIISHHMNQEVPDPIKLHVFWWDNEDIILTELQLISLSPDIAEEILNTKFDKDEEFDLKNYLFKRESNIMINKLFSIIYNSCKNNINISEDGEEISTACNENEQIKLQQWQRDVANVLSISSNLSTSFNNPSLNMLKVYNDLSKSISLAQLFQIRQHSTNLFSKQSIDIIFEKLDQIEKTDISLSSRRSFIYRCLNTIPLESPVRSHLYTKIFSQEPLPFTFYNIYLIFESENMEQNGCLFFNIINNSEMLKSTMRLKVIENILSRQKNSKMTALCCDVIQMQLSKYQIPHYILMKAMDILTRETKELQKITAIAILKVFASEFWNCIESKDSSSNPINYKFIDDLNKRLVIPIMHPLVHSFAVYLIKSLYLKGLTTYEIKQFCDARQHILPWVRVLKTDCDSRLGFNPYYYFKHFKQFDLLLREFSYSDELSVKNTLNMIAENNDMTQKISLAGIIITNFYLIRASRKLNLNENTLIQKIYMSLQSSQLSENYKLYLLDLMTNNHQLYKLSPAVKNTDLFISSVIAHVVALHLSLPANASPLSAYMQALNDHKDAYILTCPSDELSLITNVIIAKDSGTRRYQCKCGNIYFIGNCGRPDENGICNQCHSMIGGLDHVLNEGNNSIDGDKIKRSIAVKDKQGYIVEDALNNNVHSVRTLHPASYRILHLFLHIIIGIQSHLPITCFFINNQNVNIFQYCKMHIENDWKALRSIFNCEDETLALVIHAILSDMLNESTQNVEKFVSPAQREAWEDNFSRQYVLPRIKNFVGTANNFRILLDKNAENSLEINETMQTSENYLPILWRLIRKPDLDDFRSYYMSNHENQELLPLLNVFLKHEKNLSLIKHLVPIMKFIQILSSRLSHAIERQKARQLTFQQFIANECEDDDTKKIKKSLNESFNNFANSWNCLIPYIKRYQCKDLPQEMPKMHKKISIVYGLYEPTDESIYICAIIEFLVQLQNNFLNDIMEIPSETCQSLKFIEKSGAHKSEESNYYIQSTYLENAKLEQIINYDNISEVFLYCQHDLRLGHGREIHYDLYKIEAELALELLYGKKLIKTNKDQMYMNLFAYRNELFSRSMTILDEIKNLVRQEQIPLNKQPKIIENQMELLSALEIIIYFLKQTSGGDCDTLISDYVEKWMKLSVMKRYSYELLTRTGLQLKHIVALYELVEEHVADIVVNCIPTKYQAELNGSLEQDILERIDFKHTTILDNYTEIPAEAFLTALKRLIVRYLSADCEIIKENVSLSLYLVDNDSLGCWPDYVSTDLIEDKFPTTLLTSHIYSAYYFVKEKKQAIEQENQITRNSIEQYSHNRLNEESKKEIQYGRFRKS